MDSEQALLALGAGLTTAVLVAVAVIELLAVEFSALVGLPVGLLAGVAVAVAVALRASRLGLPARRALSAYAAFGPTVLGVLGLAYLNLAQSVVTADRAVAVGVTVSLAVYVARWAVDRSAA